MTYRTYDFTDEEVNLIYMALARVCVNNTNEEAVQNFKSIMKKLEPHVSEVSKMVVNIYGI